MNQFANSQHVRRKAVMYRLTSLLVLCVPLFAGCGGEERQATIPVEKVVGDTPEPTGEEPVLSGEGP